MKIFKKIFSMLPHHDLAKALCLTALTIGVVLNQRFVGLTHAAEAPPLSVPKSRTDGKKLPYNIIFITTDQERYFADFPAGTDFAGRNRLKQMGTGFEKHYTCANMCTSSRSVIYTGQHIPHSGMFDNTGLPWQSNMSTNIPTIGNMLRQAGYYTAYKGKVHLNTEIESTNNHDNIMTNAMERYGFSDFNETGDDYGHERGGYTYDITFAASALKWLRTKGANLIKEQQPWFLAVNLINPHDIMYFNTDLPGVKEQQTGKLQFEIRRNPHNTIYNKKYNDALPDNLFQPMNEAGRPKAHGEYTLGWNALVGKIPDKESNWRRYRDYYYNCLKDVDNQIVLILNAIEKLGLKDNTIIVFTSDHGEMAGNHGLRGKGPFAYEENIHLPLIIVHPDFQSGHECRAVTSHLDLAPTFVAMSGSDASKLQELTKDLHGHNLLPLLKEPKVAPADAVRLGALYCHNQFSTVDADYQIGLAKMIADGKSMSEIAQSSIRPNLKKKGSMRTTCDGRYKFTLYFSPLQHNHPQTMNELIQYNEIELYDLEKDPKEMYNLAREWEKNRELILTMNDKLNRLIAAEIGEDIGQELPVISNVNWNVSAKDLMH